MNRKHIGALFLLLACSGCCACDNSCDYLPPVLDGPYAPGGMRSGSAMGVYNEVPSPVEGEAITPLPAAE